jgi:DNA polymerase-4
VTLKLKRNDFKLLTRRASLDDGTQIADRIYRVAHALFTQADHPKPYRLIGLGLSELIPAAAADRAGDLLDPGQSRRAAAERATDAIRARFGTDAILMGRALR